MPFHALHFWLPQFSGVTVTGLPAGGVPAVEGDAVTDVWFVLLTIGVFALLAIIVRGAEKL